MWAITPEQGTKIEVEEKSLYTCTLGYTEKQMVLLLQVEQGDTLTDAHTKTLQ